MSFFREENLSSSFSSVDRRYQNYRVPRSKLYYAIPIIIVTLAAFSKVLFPTIFP